MIISPCKDCKDRYVGCHSKCEKYQEFHKANEEERERIYQLKKVEYESYAYKISSLLKKSKKRR